MNKSIAKAVRNASIGVFVVGLMSVVGLAPMIYVVVKDNNRYVRDTNGKVKVLTTPEQKQRDARIMRDMIKRFDREILEMRDDPAKFDQAVQRAEERNK